MGTLIAAALLSLPVGRSARAYLPRCMNQTLVRISGRPVATALTGNFSPTASPAELLNRSTMLMTHSRVALSSLHKKRLSLTITVSSGRTSRSVRSWHRTLVLCHPPICRAESVVVRDMCKV